VAGDDVTIEKSEIADNVHHDGRSDSHGVNVVAQAARVLVSGNRMHENTGDAVQCEDYRHPDAPGTPTDVTIENNQMSNRAGWRGEQGVDVKTCKRVSVRANGFRGFKSTSPAAGGGGAMVVHIAAREVLVEDNEVRDSCHGIGIGRYDLYEGQDHNVPKNLVVRRNDIADLKAVGGPCKGYGIGIARVRHADISANRIQDAPAYAFRLGYDDGSGPKSADVDFWENTVRRAGVFLDLNRPRIEGFASDQNRFFPDRRGFRIDGGDWSLKQWQKKADGRSVLVADPGSRIEARSATATVPQGRAAATLGPFPGAARFGGLLGRSDGGRVTALGTSATTMFALGDGATGGTQSKELARYIERQHPDRFLYLGDVYESGTAEEFKNNYEPIYGSLAARTDPVLGNHEFKNRDKGGYYAYWRKKRGWSAERARHRSYVTPEGWQVIAYSSEHAQDAEYATREAAWVEKQVSKHGGTCRIAMAHRGRHVVTDSAHGDNRGQERVWSKLRHKTAVDLRAHNHIFGRLSPIDGINVLVSGAGGARLREFGRQHHRVAAKLRSVHTATKLTLRRGRADFQQVDKDGDVHDRGTIRCVPAP